MDLDDHDAFTKYGSSIHSGSFLGWMVGRTCLASGLPAQVRAKQSGGPGRATWRTGNCGRFRPFASVRNCLIPSGVAALPLALVGRLLRTAPGIRNLDRSFHVSARHLEQNRQRCPEKKRAFWSNPFMSCLHSALCNSSWPRSGPVKPKRLVRKSWVAESPCAQGIGAIGLHHAPGREIS